MSWLRGIAYRLRSLARPHLTETERDDEMAFHLDMQTRRNMARGMTPAAARALAEREFGRLVAVKDELRDARGASALEGLLYDARYALRVLRRQPAFTAIAVATLAIGIGATTAIFSVLDAALLRPLPFREPERLMSVALRMPAREGGGAIDMVWSVPKFEAFRDAQRLFQGMALHRPESFMLSDPDGAERVEGELVSGSYFEVLGLEPARGRAFSVADDRPGGEPVVVLGHGFWTSRFAADPAVVGRALRLNGRPFTVVGVAAPGFRGLGAAADLWVPIAAGLTPAALTQVGAHQFSLTARLAAGVTVAQAKGAMAALGRHVDATYPDDFGRWGAAVYSFAEVRADPMLRRALFVLAGAVGLVLLIACVNIANLLLARGAARRRELAVRLAIGADRSRLVRQLFTESGILAGVGALASVGVAWAGVRALASVAPSRPEIFGDAPALATLGLSAIRLDGSAFALTAALAVLTGLLFGLAPALQVSRAQLGHAMKQGGAPAPGLAGARTLRGRGALVVLEVALAVVLLVTSGLMIRSLGRLFEARLGFDPANVLTLRVTLDRARWAPDSASALWRDVTATLAALPGVESVGMASCSPVGENCEGTTIEREDRALAAHVAFHHSSPDLFRTLRVPLLRGRTFGPADRFDGPPVVVLNEAAARRLWGTVDVVGRRVRGTFPEPAEVVGVVGDARFERIDAPPYPAIFVSYEQSPRSRAMVFLRSGGDPAALSAAARRAIRRVNREHAVYDASTLSARLYDATSRARFNTLVLGTFAAVALLLASIGIYGIMSLAVAQRTRELGIRLALGADAGRLRAMVLGRGMLLAGAGAVAGFGVAAVAGRVLGALLYEVAPLDPWTYGASALLLGGVAAAAAYLPARRATRVNPLEALRAE